MLADRRGVGSPTFANRCTPVNFFFKRSCNQLRWISRAIRGQLGVRIRGREQLEARIRGRGRRASGHPWVRNQPHRQPRPKWISGLRGRSSRKIPCWCCRRHLRTCQWRRPCRTSPWCKRPLCRPSSGPETLRGWCSQIQRSCRINQEFVAISYLSYGVLV